MSKVAVAGITAITPRRVILRIAEMIVQLPFQGAPGHHLGQLPPAARPRRSASARRHGPAGTGPLGKLTQDLLTGRRQLHSALVLAGRHASHWCLLVCQELHR
jgi:hypothetical protein